jgi:hypothetical protein
VSANEQLTGNADSEAETAKTGDDLQRALNPTVNIICQELTFEISIVTEKLVACKETKQLLITK